MHAKLGRWSMPFQTRTDFSIKRAATPATSATFARVSSGFEAKRSESSNCSKGVKTQIFSQDRAEQAAEDATWRAWVDGCPRYYEDCFTCDAAMLDQVYFCRKANQAVFGTDMIEVEILKDEGAGCVRP